MKKTIHPYIPNSVPEVKRQMLAEIGAESIDELYQDIPEEIRYMEKLAIPEGLGSEYQLQRHVNGILRANLNCQEFKNFMGYGCYQHYVPAICDEINQRSEFLTAYAGEPFEDHGRFQAMFEYESMMAELLDMDVVNVPTYDWGQAAATSLRMAGRITKRNKVLVSGAILPERLSIIENYCKGVLTVELIDVDEESGLISLEDLKEKLGDNVAAVYFENPSVFGTIETRGQEISDLAHDKNALSVVGCDPVSLGVLTPPSQYGADIVNGDIQGLGMHMQYGGGQAGFIATRDEPEYVMQYPSRLFGIEKTRTEGEWGFGDVAWDRTSFADRDNCNEFIGTATALWGITAGVYLALMGPQGMKELGQGILQRSLYLRKQLSALKGVSIKFSQAPAFKEFVVDFSQTGLTTDEINEHLLSHGIFGGVDLSKDFPDLKNCALYCVTETHTQEDMDELVASLKELLNQ